MPYKEELDAIAERSRRGLERSRKLPSLVLWWLARRSVVMRGMREATGTFVSDMTTYLFKLGPDNLPSHVGTGFDREMLAGIGPVACRLRLREAARQIANAVRPSLSGRQGPLWIFSVGGGVAAEAFNALLIIRKECPALLNGRALHIVVHDVDRTDRGSALALSRPCARSRDRSPVLPSASGT